MVSQKYVVLVAWNDNSEDAICEFLTLKDARRFMGDCQSQNGILGLTLLRRVEARDRSRAGEWVPSGTDSKENADDTAGEVH